MSDNPGFERIGPPRPVQFSQWGTLHADGTYQRLDDKPRTPITVGNGDIGVCVVKSRENENLTCEMDGFDRAFLDHE